jgi:hypothetical protein
MTKIDKILTAISMNYFYSNGLIDKDLIKSFLHDQQQFYFPNDAGVNLEYSINSDRKYPIIIPYFLFDSEEHQTMFLLKYA